MMRGRSGRGRARARSWLWGALVFTAVSSGGAAQASGAGKQGTVVAQAPPSRGQLAQAQKLFSEGQALLQAENFPEAAEKFRAASQIKSTPGIHYHIAHCLERSGLLIEAREEYELVGALLETQSARDVEKLLPEATRRVQLLIPHVSLERLPDHSRVWVDHVELQQESLLLLEFNPGEHELRIEAAGYETVTRRFSLKPGQHLKFESGLREKSSETLSPAPPSVPREEQRSHSALRSTVFWSSVGVAGVGLGVGLAGLGIQRAASEEVVRMGAQIDAGSSGDKSACLDPGEALSSLCKGLNEKVLERDRATTLIVTGFSALIVGTTSALITQLLWEEAPVQITASPWIEAEKGARLRGGWVSVQGAF